MSCNCIMKKEMCLCMTCVHSPLECGVFEKSETQAISCERKGKIGVEGCRKYKIFIDNFIERKPTKLGQHLKVAPSSVNNKLRTTKEVSPIETSLKSYLKKDSFTDILHTCLKEADEKGSKAIINYLTTKLIRVEREEIIKYLFENFESQFKLPTKDSK